MADVIEAMAQAVVADIGRQFDAKPAHVEGSWSSTGGVIDAEQVIRAALRAAEQAGWVLTPREPTKAMVTAGLINSTSPLHGIMHDIIAAAVNAGRLRLETRHA